MEKHLVWPCVRTLSLCLVVSRVRRLSQFLAHVELIIALQTSMPTKKKQICIRWSWSIFLLSTWPVCLIPPRQFMEIWSLYLHFSKSTAASTLAGVYLDFLCFYLYSICVCIVLFCSVFHTPVSITYDAFAEPLLCWAVCSAYKQTKFRKNTLWNNVKSRIDLVKMTF